MKVKIKLLDRNLIRTFGGVVQEMDIGKAQRFVDQGKAAFEDSKYKGFRRPPQHKAIFEAPEDKVMESFESDRYPGPEDKLFPKVKKGK
jgi:hypothetical protein